MSSNMRESTIKPPESSSSRDTGNNDSGDFECNICFELAEDPIVTLCGHLFCWPCLYKWLHIHSHSHECPVCKALIEEDKLIPLYGRGKKTQTDPRSKPIPDLEIPHRPAGQRPATAPPPDNNNNNNNNFPNFGFGGFAPMASARFGNFSMSAGFGGLFPSLLDTHVHGFQNPLQYGPRGYGPRFINGFHGGHHVHEIFHSRRGNQENNFLKTFLLMFGIFMVLIMIL